jgi:hypothetical protein
MTTFGLDLSVANAHVTVFFNLVNDDGDSYVDFEDMQVMYKGVDIFDTLDENDLATLEKQIYSNWDSIENQFYESKDGW